MSGKKQTYTGGTGAIVRINRTLCTICRGNGYDTEDSVTGTLEILDNGMRYIPRKCRHEREMIAAPIPGWVHEMRRKREAGGVGGPVIIRGIVADVLGEAAEPTMAERIAASAPMSDP